MVNNWTVLCTVRVADRRICGHSGLHAPAGSSLVKLGQAHCKIALAQEALALTLQSSYLDNLEASADEIREYEAERKALETRRYVLARRNSYPDGLTSSQNQR